jgi:transcriptional regulator with XRE-family HTH domain
MNVILLVGVLSLGPVTTATASTLPRDPGRLVSRWTNSGTVAQEVEPERAFADAVLEVRRTSGLTWEQLASLVGVDRRSVHLWASGRPMSAPNAERLNRILAVLRRIDRGTPSATRAWLHAPSSQGLLPLDLLREGRFDEIVVPGAAGASPRPAPLSNSARMARAPRPPADLIGARQDRVHIESGKLIAATPLKVSRPK